MKRVILFALLCSGLLSATAIAAAEAEDESESPTEASEESDAQRSGRDSRDAGTADVFVPSEEISEDVSVAFPVDI